jgi:hypothetical protein
MELGRKTSLSPLETAKAFGATLVRVVDDNATAQENSERVGTRSVKYGEASVFAGEGAKFLIPRKTLKGRFYAAEHQARQQYEQLKTRLDIIEQQNQDMKKLVSGKQPQVQYAIPANTRYQNKQNSFDNFNDDRFSRFNRNKPEELPKVSFKEVTEVETIPSARRLTGTKQTEVTSQNQAGTADSSSAAPYQRQYDGRGNNWSNNGWRSRSNYRNNNIHTSTSPCLHR